MVSLGRFGTASTSTGTGYELTVIAAAVVGGASLTGGRGTAIGALLGTLVIALIENGIIILRLAQEYRLIIIGLAIIVAVSLDRLEHLHAQPAQIEKGVCADLLCRSRGEQFFTRTTTYNNKRESPMKTNYLITTTVAAAIAGLAFFAPVGRRPKRKRRS